MVTLSLCWLVVPWRFLDICLIRTAELWSIFLTCMLDFNSDLSFAACLYIWCLIPFGTVETSSPEVTAFLAEHLGSLIYMLLLVEVWMRKLLAEVTSCRSRTVKTSCQSNPDEPSNFAGQGVLKSACWFETQLRCKSRNRRRFWHTVSCWKWNSAIWADRLYLAGSNKRPLRIAKIWTFSKLPVGYFLGLVVHGMLVRMLIPV